MPTPDLDNRFIHHPPDEQRALDHERTRRIIREVANTLEAELPDGREKALVMTKLEEALFWANASIARQK